MGEAADQLTEAEGLAYLEHLHGVCDTVDPCQYCYEEEKNGKKGTRGDVQFKNVPRNESSS